jgi:hypothetical protein
MPYGTEIEQSYEIYLNWACLLHLH